MNGEALLALLLPLIKEASEYAAQALELREDYDPTLERQVRALVDVANQRLTSADLTIKAEDEKIDAILK
jgi:hypothetical protein